MKKRIEVWEGEVEDVMNREYKHVIVIDNEGIEEIFGDFVGKKIRLTIETLE